MKGRLILAALVLFTANAGFAAPVYWFGDGTTEGGNGTWDTLNLHFSTSQTGPADMIWDNITNPGDPVFESAPGTVTVSSITNNGTLTDNSGYTFTGSTLTLGPSSAINVAAGLTTTMNSVLAGGPLTKNGTGTLVVNSASTYTNTYLNEGTLALGPSGNGNLGVIDPANRLIINGSGVTIAQMRNTGTNPQQSVDQLTDFTYDNGALGASGNMQFTLQQSTGAGTWAVQGNRTITTLANTGGGFLLIGPANAFPDRRIVSYDGGPASLTKDGPGTLAMQAENDLTGGFTILDGTVRVNIHPESPFGSGTLTLSGGSLATVGNRTSPITNTVNVTADFTVTTTSAANPIAFPFSGPLNGTVNTTLYFKGNTTAGQAFNPSLSGGFDYVGKINVSNNGGPTTLQLLNTPGDDQTFEDVIWGDGVIWRNSTSLGAGGTTYMNGANIYSGGTELDDGSIGLGKDSTPGPGGGAITDGSLGTGTLTVTPVAGGLPTLFTSGTIAPGDQRYLGNAINLASTEAPLVVSNADGLLLYGQITGAGSITKKGAGQLRISPPGGGYNKYSGGTRIEEGSVACDSSSSGTDPGVNWGSAGTGTITMAGGGLSGLSAPNVRTIGNHILFDAATATLGNPVDGADLVLAGNVDLNGWIPTITVDNNTHSVTISGQISNGGLTKDGPTTLVLSGTNIYVGGTTVTAGTLEVQKDGGLGSGNVTVTSGAILRLTNGVANTYIDSAANLTLNGASPLVKLDYTGTPNQIGALYFGAVQQANGTWGAIGSGANHESAFFTGTGMLLVGTSVITPVTSFGITNGPGSNMTLSYSGGSGAQFVLLQTNNVAAPLSLWTRLQTNTTSPGTFTITPGTDPKEFYRVKSE